MPMFKQQQTTLIFALTCMSVSRLYSGGDQPQMPQVGRVDSFQVNQAEAVLIRAEGGTHNYHQHSDPDFSQGGHETSMSARMKNAAQYGFLQGISTLVAQVVVQTTAALISLGLRKLVSKMSTHEETYSPQKLQEITSNVYVMSQVLKSQNQMVQEQCAAAQTDEEKNQCEILKLQMRQLLVIHANHIIQNLVPGIDGAELRVAGDVPEFDEPEEHEVIESSGVDLGIEN